MIILLCLLMLLLGVVLGIVLYAWMLTFNGYVPTKGFRWTK